MQDLQDVVLVVAMQGNVNACSSAMGGAVPPLLKGHNHEAVRHFM